MYDISGVEESPDSIEGGMVNYRKLEALGTIVHQVKRAQMIGFKHKESAFLGNE